jgi:ATP-dependent protease HslVU (ClpYQ) peptidase subunit
MSIGVSVSKGGIIALAADTLMLSGVSKCYRSKLYRTKDFAIAVSGEGVTWQFLLDFMARHPKTVMRDQLDLFRLVQAIYKEAISYNLVAPGTVGLNTPYGGLGVSVLMACPNGAWYTDVVNGVYPINSFEGIGSGREFAMGYLHGQDKNELGAEELARGAVACSIHFCAACGGDIEVATFKTTKRT